MALLTRHQLLSAQTKAGLIILVMASLIGMSEGILATNHDFGVIPTDVFAVYNFLVLGIGGVFLTRAVLYRFGLVTVFFGRTRRFLSDAKKGLLRNLANAAVFPIVQDAWSQTIQVIYSQPANVLYYDVITVIFPRPAWESWRYGELGYFFGRPAGPLNFPYWYYIWVGGIVAYMLIDLVRLYGDQIGTSYARLLLKLTPRRILSLILESRLGRLYSYLRLYAELAFSGPF